MDKIKKKLQALPMCPGVYIMKNCDDDVIYVGKSKALKNRVNQYFVNLSSHTPKTRAMVSQIADFEYMITDSEAEALALECNLIKKYKPKYNILLKDDKQYPYIKITKNELFPQIYMTRQIKNDGCMYFGPYVAASSLKETIEEIRKTFKIRNCKKKIDNNLSRPCLFYQMGQCSAPCAGKITPEDYMNYVEGAISMLNGDFGNVTEILKHKMYTASEMLDFEKAAQFRDQIKRIEALTENQKVTNVKNENTDVIGVYKEGSEYCIQIFYYRGGKVVGAEYFTFEDITDSPDIVAENFVKQFYFTASLLPKEILINEQFSDLETIAKWLSKISGHKVEISIPKRGKKKEIIEMVLKNAKESLYKHRLNKSKTQVAQNRILSDLSKTLNLNKIPFRIELYDISNFSGDSSVGAQVVYANALPQKSKYRKYTIKTVTGQDDYECMREVIFRRFNEGYKEEDLIKSGELKSENAKFLPFPDLIFVDGGKGHVSAINLLMNTLGEDIPVYGLVKDNNHKTRGIVDENTEFFIDKKTNLFMFLSGMQDEVHRFAISFSRKKQERKNINSVLENIPGVGSATRKKLLKAFSGINKIKSASIEELSNIVSPRVAKEIYNYFNK